MVGEYNCSYDMLTSLNAFCNLEWKKVKTRLTKTKQQKQSKRNKQNKIIKKQRQQLLMVGKKDIRLWIRILVCIYGNTVVDQEAMQIKAT